jgi:chorismate-pyruvate lyase
MVAAGGKHLGDDVLLAEVVLGNVFDDTPLVFANSVARSRTRSRSGSANRG